MEKRSANVESDGESNLGELVWGSFLWKKKFRLHVGTFTIGRVDADAPSDIQLNDKRASRRSAVLDVFPGKDGFLFKFTVKRAYIPVYVNDSEIAEGQSTYLNYGDKISMGDTVLTFRKSE